MIRRRWQTMGLINMPGMSMVVTFWWSHETLYIRCCRWKVLSRFRPLEIVFSESWRRWSDIRGRMMHPLMPAVPRIRTGFSYVVLCDVRPMMRSRTPVYVGSRCRCAKGPWSGIKVSGIMTCGYVGAAAAAMQRHSCYGLHTSPPLQLFTPIFFSHPMQQ